MVARQSEVAADGGGVLGGVPGAEGVVGAIVDPEVGGAGEAGDCDGEPPGGGEDGEGDADDGGEDEAEGRGQVGVHAISSSR